MHDAMTMQRCPPNTVAYVIKPGDTLYSLARRFGTTVDAILSINPLITDPESLRVGQRICIPRQPVYPACPEGNYYVIRQGDTLYSIARRYNISLDDLLEANPGINASALAIGQVICIPLATPPVTCPTGFAAYTIQAGDTFYSIARRSGTTVAKLRAANPSVNPNTLLVGQVICIPG